MKRLNSKIVFGLAIFWPLCLTLAGPSDANSLPDATLVKIKFDQKIGSQVAPGLKFVDESGTPVILGNYLGTKPVILDLGYYRCPMLCTLVLNGMIECLQDLKLNMGEQFEVVCVSIDPRETPTLAAAKKKTYLRRYGRPGASAGWHFLTGDESAIRQLADEVGFHYAFDPKIGQYAHPSGLVLLTPDGKVSRYFFGIDFSAKEMDVALKQAAVRKTGSPVEQLILLCFHYSPLTGKYGNLIMGIVRASGVAMVISLAGVMLLVTQRHKKRAAAPDKENTGP